MLKPDASIDYYAILGIRPSADTAEIKKQFKKLALKYHPDRNPGKETDVNAKFQEISCAHEVLSDPEARERYDASRNRFSRANLFDTRPAPPPTTRPAPPTTRPPPPRRTAPVPTQPPPARPPPASNGHFASYTAKDSPWKEAANKQAYGNPTDDAQGKGAAFKAWEAMRAQNAQSKAPPPKAPAPRASRASRTNNFPNPANGNNPDGIPRSVPPFEWAQPERPSQPPNMARSNTTRPARRPEFGQTAPAPQAASTSAFAAFGRPRPSFERSAGAYPPPPPGGPPPGVPLRPTMTNPEPTRAFKSPTAPRDPLRAFKSPTGDDPFGSSDRLSTPYATQGGEKTYFSSDALHRSTSAASGGHADPPAWSSANGHLDPRGKPTTPEVPGRYRSASPKMKSPHEQSSTDSSYTSEEDGITMKKGATAGEARRASADHRMPSQTFQGHSRPSAHPSTQAEVDTPSANEDNRRKNRQTWQGGNLYANARPQSASRSSSRNGSGSERPDGLFTQRSPRDAEPNAYIPPSPLRTNAPWNAEGPEVMKPLQKATSWQEGRTRDTESRSEPPTAGGAHGLPKYATSSFQLFESARPPCLATVEETPSEHAVQSGTEHAMHDTHGRGQRPARGSPPPPHPKPVSVRRDWKYWEIPSSVFLSPRREASQDGNEKAFHLSYTTKQSLPPHANQLAASSLKIPPSNPSPPPWRSPSAENVDTQFSPPQWHGKFTAEQTDHRGAKKADGAAQPSRSPGMGPSTTSLDTEPASRGPHTHSASTSMPPPPQPTSATSLGSPDKFDGGTWSNEFKEATWAYPIPPPLQSPRPGNAKRTKSSRKMSTAQKRPAISKPVGVSTSEGSTGASSTSTGVPVIDLTDDSPPGSAMDVDPALTPSSPFATASENVDPITNIIRSAVPPTVPQEPTPHPAASRLNMHDLKSSVLFSSNEAGLEDLTDVKSALPFESASSGTTERVAARSLQLPPIPKAPDPPEKLTADSWHYFMVFMRKYMVEWNLFNHKMLGHFTSRQDSVETSLGDNWMGVLGNDGFNRYMRGVEEDFKVRTHWNVSWEKHLQCMRTLAELRDMAKRCGLGLATT